MRAATKVAVLAAAALLISAPAAFAFHSGGVAECEGCHSMHNSFEGLANVTGRTLAEASGPWLLKANDQSGSCLNCHAAADVAPSSYHVATIGVEDGNTVAPVEMTPGGDFAWLRQNPTYVVRGSTLTNHGERRGHNVIAADFGYIVDSSLTVAPGGTYPANQLHCSSCHDPHGKYRRFADGSIATTGLPIFNAGSYNNSKDPIASVSAVGAYRILAGIGYQPKSLAGSFAFANTVPAAVVASTYNRTEATTQTGVAYGQGMSEWCVNCHTAFLSNGYTSGMAGLRHPAGNAAPLGAAIAANYNSYVSSGIMTNVTDNKAFSTLAPFELNSADYTVLKPQAVTAGAGVSNHAKADAGSNAMCLSCHRAHASGFESMLRYFYMNEFMTLADASNAAIYAPANSAQGQGFSEAAQTNAYYGRPATVFGPQARSYCNKCHAKD